MCQNNFSCSSKLALVFIVCLQIVVRASTAKIARFTTYNLRTQSVWWENLCLQSVFPDFSDRKTQIYPHGAQPCLLCCSRIVKDSLLEGCLLLAHNMALTSCGEISQCCFLVALHSDIRPSSSYIFVSSMLFFAYFYRLNFSPIMNSTLVNT